MFAAFAFEPMLYHGDLLRVIREGVYVPLAVGVLALCAASLRARDAALSIRLIWAAALGGAVGLLWLTREEGPWILPTLACAGAALAAARCGRRDARRSLVRDAAVAATVAVAAISPVQLTSALNERWYGTWTAVEFRQPAFARAYGALVRVEPEHRVPDVPVTRASLGRAADVSPAVAEIARVLLSGAKDGYARYGCAYHGLDPCDGEFRGGWFMFALRDAAALAGHHETGAGAERFYARLASEIDVAGAARRLACGSPRSGFAPPLAPGDAVAIGALAMRGADRLARFSGFALEPAASTGNETQIARYTVLHLGARRSRATRRASSTIVRIARAPCSCARSRACSRGSCRRSCSRAGSRSPGRCGTGRARSRRPGSGWPRCSRPRSPRASRS